MLQTLAAYTTHLPELLWKKVPSKPEFLCKALTKISIIKTEGFCVLTQVVPNMVRWFYAKYKGEITSETLQYTISKVEKYTIGKVEKSAYLYEHHSKNKAPRYTILFLHGDHSHPLTLLPLIQIAQKIEDLKVYSLHMPTDPTHGEFSKDFIQQTLERFKNENLILVGHSKGAIQSAYTAFVEKKRGIKAMVSIAGRLQCVPNDGCHPKLKPLIEEVAEAIKNNRHLPLYQIVPEKDWNAPIDAMQIRPATSTIIKGAMHFNVLYKKETKEAFTHYLTTILQN